MTYLYARWVSAPTFGLDKTSGNHRLESAGLGAVKVHLTPKFFFAKKILHALVVTYSKKLFDFVKSSIFMPR